MKQKVIYSFLFFTLFTACNFSNQDKVSHTTTGSTEIKKYLTSSPVVSPEESIKKISLEEGFAIKLVAAEPLVSAPVALTFDNRGRIWLVEMQGYMPDVNGKGEDKANGKIVILEDNNKDGVFDTRKVFMDSLVMPRAICLIENGILIAEPPQLNYFEIVDDKPGKKAVVDDRYTEGGNPESQSNGLFRALDNWIYSAESKKRYRKKGGQWLTEYTHRRGQWGISQDDHGRLFYNNNSQNILGDYFTPGFGSTNKNQRNVAGYNEKIVSDTRVFPSRPTTGVNRGYKPGILDSNLRLVNFTAACGPLIYRGNLFGEQYYSNAFVAEPAAYLIKRNILENKGHLVNGAQAYSDREFLTSTDERFRPVNLYNGPDGALYVVDMYRGIIQHRIFLTDYLKGEIKKRELVEPLNCGRIYKITPEKHSEKSIVISDNPEQLLDQLQDANGYIRDKAQQNIIDRNLLQVIPRLRKILNQKNKPISAIHALWTLEGLHVLETNDVLPLLRESDWILRMQAYSIMPSILNKKTYKQYLPVLEKIMLEKKEPDNIYISFIAKNIEPFDRASADRIRGIAMKQFPDNIYVADALISGIQDREAEFLKKSLAFNSDSSLILNQRLKKVLEDIRNSNTKNDPAIVESHFPKGAVLYKSICQACHGMDGNGVKSLAPPLNNSDWVTGDKNRLISILLHGLSGPIKVSEKKYGPPEINGEMPGLANNPQISDEDLAQLVNYIRNSWNNNAATIRTQDVSGIRQKYKGRQKTFTMDDF